MRCPIDGTPLVERQEGAIALGDCEQCHGSWIPGRVTRALLEGEVTLPENGGTAAMSRVPPLMSRRVVCSDCNGRLRPTAVTDVWSCVRCGAIWVPSGDMNDVARWQRGLMQAGALALLQPTNIPLDPRAGSGAADANRLLLGGTLALALMTVLTFSAAPGFFRTLRPYALFVAGLALIASGLRFRSSASPGALTRKGFGIAIAGVALVIFGLLDLR
jgi:Zn-finger nucleic acid-binding protein